MVNPKVPSANPYPLLESPRRVPNVKGVHVPVNGLVEVARSKYPKVTRLPSPLLLEAASKSAPFLSFKRMALERSVSVVQWITTCCSLAKEVESEESRKEKNMGVRIQADLAQLVSVILLKLISTKVSNYVLELQLNKYLR